MRRLAVVLLLLLVSCNRPKPPKFDRIDLDKDGACARTVPGHQTICWGDKWGPDPKLVPTPIDREPRTKVTGTHHECERQPNNTVACSGDNTKNQLADGTTEKRDTPVLVQGIIGAVDIAAAENATCVALGDGDIRCWGENDHGQLGPNAPRGVLNVPTILRLPPMR